MKAMNRTAEITRKTRETDIKIKLDLDKSGEVSIDTGIGFLDHMLTALAVHGGFSLSVKCVGDLNVDGHHTTEDIGIVLGMAFREALGDKSGIMFLVFNAQFTNERVGEFDTCLTEEFMRSFAFNAGITLHLRVEYGSNDHHKIEALFKALAYALKAAVKRNTDGSAVSTKGVL